MAFSIFICKGVVLNAYSQLRDPVMCLGTNKRSFWSALREDEGAPSCPALLGHGTGARVSSVPPELGLLGAILPDGAAMRPCSGLASSEALSGFWGGLRAELGAETRGRLKVWGQLAGRRLEGEEDVQKEPCWPCRSLLLPALNRALSSSRSWWSLAWMQWDQFPWPAQ